MFRILLTFLLLCPLAVGVQGQGHSQDKAKGKPVKPPPVWNPYPNPGWLLEYSSGTTLRFTPEGQPYFAFPTQSSKSANLLSRDWPGAAYASQITVTLRLVTTGAPVFQLAQGPEPCTNPPAARIWFASRRWQSTLEPRYEWNRFWSVPGFLALGGAGTFTFSASLDPATWINVNGHPATEQPDDFYRVLGEVNGRIGLVFGGGCSYGHGLWVSGGTAVLTVLAYEVQ